MTRTTKDKALLLFGKRCLFVDSDVEQDGCDADGSASKQPGGQRGEDTFCQLQTDSVRIPSHIQNPTLLLSEFSSGYFKFQSVFFVHNNSKSDPQVCKIKPIIYRHFDYIWLFFRKICKSLIMIAMLHTHTHTQLFNGPSPETTRVSRYQFNRYQKKHSPTLVENL